MLIVAIFSFESGERLELNSKRLYRSLEKEKESRCLVSTSSNLLPRSHSVLPWEIWVRDYTSSTKREIRPFYVVVVQWRQRNAQKKRDTRSPCRLHRRYLSSLFAFKNFLNWSRKVKIRHFQTCRHNWRAPKTELAVRNLLETAFHSWPSSLQATLTSLSIWAAAELSAVSEEDKIRCDFNSSYHWNYIRIY